MTGVTSSVRAAPSSRGRGRPATTASPAIPDDPLLPGLRQLFDCEWAWARYCQEFGRPDDLGERVRVRVRQFLYQPGARAVIGYVMEREWGQWILEEQFACELRAGGRERLFRYPDDPYLPGLASVASSLAAHALLPQCVPLHPYRLIVEGLRYRPTARALLRHHALWRRRDATPVTLYVRVMPPHKLAGFLTAGELALRSGFLIPRLAGCLPEGGVAWMANTPGKTVRALIREGAPPEADRILDGLLPLWSAAADGGMALDLAGGFRLTQGMLARVLPPGGARRLFQGLVAELAPFVEAWRPSGLAHNDFYEDQIIVTPDQRIALVDFEEVGPGDPLMDVGNMLAHLRWMARFSSASVAFDSYRRAMRAAALARCGWEARALALREAYALFRLSTNPVRHAKDGWLEAVEAVLEMAAEVLAGE